MMISASKADYTASKWLKLWQMPLGEHQPGTMSECRSRERGIHTPGSAPTAPQMYSGSNPSSAEGVVDAHTARPPGSASGDGLTMHAALWRQNVKGHCNFKSTRPGHTDIVCVLPHPLRDRHPPTPSVLGMHLATA